MMPSDGLFQANRLSPLFTVHVQEGVRKLNLPQECGKAVEQIWQEQLKISGGKLFNGQLLCFGSLQEDMLTGKFVDYKYYLAQHIMPSLQPVLQIEPIGVSSLTVAGGKILCGCRSRNVSTYPEYFELAPSGGIDSGFVKGGMIDLKGQLVSELFEETGIHQENVVSAEPFALVHDKLKGGYDICMKLQLKPEAQKKTLSKSHEYGSLSWKDKDELSKEIQTKKNWVPLSVYLIEHFL